VAVEQGDRLQRCATREAPARQHELLARLNRLLDARTQHPGGPGALPEGSSGLVPWLLDGYGGTLALLDGEGRVLSASREALELLASDRGPSLRDAMGRAVTGVQSESVSTLRRSEHWTFVALTPAPEATHSDGVKESDSSSR
jgi:hypothetical protein